MPDAPSDNERGEQSPYALPSAYGPAIPPRRDELDDEIPTVTLHDRDTTIEVTPATAPDLIERADTTEPRDQDAADSATIAGLSRREIREQREREASGPKRQRSTGTAAKKPRSTHAKWTRRIVALAIVVALVPVAISYVDYINRPGSDSLSVRSVEWIRDHGGNGIVNTIERWWYTNNPPPTGGSPDAIKTQKTVVEGTGTTTAATQIQHLAAPIARVPTPATDVQQNEGVWQPTGRLVAGLPAVYTTYVRPDAVHTSFYTGLMWLDTKLLRNNYVVGTEQPGGGPNPWGSKIAPDQVPNAIAAFNSGFKMDSANGGAYLDGQEIVPLRAGAASLVVNQDGSSNVGVWGRDFSMSPDVKAVRQNLVLIVDGGQLNPEMREDDTTAFGAMLGNDVSVWRSGVGVTADGALVYAGGPAMSIIALARTLQAAGAVRAMEMGINIDWVSAFTYQPNVTVAGDPIEGVKLLDGMTHSGSQYLETNTRDFFAFTADPKVVVPTSTTTTTTTRPKSKSKH